MRVGVLGPLSVTDETGAAVDLERAQYRRLLVALVLEANRVVPADRLIDELWGEQPPASAAGSLQVLVSRLRKALGSERIVRRPPGYCFRVSADEVDAAEFERLVATGRQLSAAGEPAQALASFDRALALWRGSPYPEFADEDFARAEVARLTELHAVAEEDRSGAALALGQHAETVADLRRLVAEQPLRERRWAQLVLALYRSGRQADALRAVAELRTLLGEELGLEPSAEIRELEDAVILQKPELAWEPKEAAVDAEGGDVWIAGGPGPPQRFQSVASAVDHLLRAQDPALGFAVHVGDPPGGAALALALAGMAQPGQLLLSAEARRALNRTGLPRGWALEDLGEQVMHDLTSRRVYLLATAARTDAAVPPARLRPLGTRAHNLPAQRNPLIGRDDILDEVVTALEPGELVTVVGQGGVGKTRLALHAAATVAGRFADGVWHVDLAGIQEQVEAPSLLAQVLAVAPAPNQNPVDAVASAIGPGAVLVVLDTCEHVLAGAAELATSLLERCPGLAVLATSRQLLGVAGEHVVRLGGLPVPDADDDAEQSPSVALFLSRAAAGPRGVPFGDDAGAVRLIGAVCRELDGLPLALELAAARTQIMGIREVAARLSDRFRLLRGGPAGRHETMWSAIAWSHELLDERQRMVLRRLAVFPGDFSLAGAEAVAVGVGIEPEDVLDVVVELLDRSVLNVSRSGTATRYALPDAIRHFGSQQLDAHGERASCGAAHAQYVLELVEHAAARFNGPDEPAELQRLAPELTNVRAALTWAENEAAEGRPELLVRLVAAFGVPWEAFGLFAEGKHWAERGAACAEGVPGSAGTEALYVAGRLADRCGDYGRARLWYGRALDRTSPSDLAGRSRALVFLAWIDNRQGDLDQARLRAEEALELAVRADDLRGQLRAHVTIGSIACDASMFEVAGEHLDISYALARRLGDPSAEAVALSNLSNICELQGDWLQAWRWANESVALARRIGDHSAIGIALGVLSTAAVKATELGLVSLEQARELCQQAVEELRATGELLTLAHALGDLGVITARHGDVATGAALHQEQISICRAIGDRPGLASALVMLGYDELDREEPAFATKHFTEALTVARAAAAVEVEARALTGLAATAVVQGDPGTARRHLEDSLAIWRRLGVAPRAEQAERELAALTEAESPSPRPTPRRAG